MRNVIRCRNDAWKCVKVILHDLKYLKTSEIVVKCSEVTEIVFRVIENNLKLRLTARKCVKPTGNDEKTRPAVVRDLNPVAYATWIPIAYRIQSRTQPEPDRARHRIQRANDRRTYFTPFPVVLQPALAIFRIFT